MQKTQCSHASASFAFIRKSAHTVRLTEELTMAMRTDVERYKDQLREQLEEFIRAIKNNDRDHARAVFSRLLEETNSLEMAPSFW